MSGKVTAMLPASLARGWYGVPVVLVLVSGCVAATPRARVVKEPPDKTYGPEPVWEPKFDPEWWRAGQLACPGVATLGGAAYPRGLRIWCRGPDGQQHGPSTSFHANGQVKSHTWARRGVPIGRSMEWFENGNPHRSGRYANGQRHGKWLLWHPNGTKARHSDFILGRRNGKWVSWNELGRKYRETEYLLGEMVGMVEVRDGIRMAGLSESGHNRSGVSETSESGNVSDGEPALGTRKIPRKTEEPERRIRGRKQKRGKREKRLLGDSPSPLMTINARYMSGLRRCFKRALREDPTVGGRVSVRFRVGKRGTVTWFDAEGSPSVEECIEAQGRSWVFSVVRDRRGRPIEAEFALTLALQSN